MSKTTNIIETIKQHQDAAAEHFAFGEASAIIQSDGELTEKLALAFTLGYMRGSGANERDGVKAEYVEKITELMDACEDVALLDLVYKIMNKSKKEG